MWWIASAIADILVSFKYIFTTYFKILNGKIKDVQNYIIKSRNAKDGLRTLSVEYNYQQLKTL